MLIAIGCFSHESNSFDTQITTLDKFKDVFYCEANQLIENFRGNHRALGGFIDECTERNWDILPLGIAQAFPSGPIDSIVYNNVKTQFISQIQAHTPDAILLHLHGASVVDGLADAEGDLLTSLRNVVGKQIPILVLLDLHGNVSQLMVDQADIIIGYNKQPHIDIYERECELVQICEDILVHGKKTCMAYVQPPLLVPAILTDTALNPMKSIFDQVYLYEKENDVINVSAFAGFYGSDKYTAGPCCVAITDNNPQKAYQIAQSISELFWDKRDEFLPKIYSINEAITESTKYDGPVAFVDEADDPLGGGPADGTYILGELLNNKITDVAICTIHDEEIVRQAYSVGINGKVTGNLGGKKTSNHGNPIAIEGNVILLFDEPLPVADWDPDVRFNVGKIAVIEVNGIHIIVTERKTPTESINLFKYLGMNISDFKILVLKGMGITYEQVFREQIKKYMPVESIGITNPDVTKLGTFTRLRHPVYPIDKFNI